MNQLANLGSVVERVMSNPVHIELDPAPVCGAGEFTGKSLLDTWREFDPKKWTVARLEGAVFRRRKLDASDTLVRAAWYSPPPPDENKYKAVIFCEMQTIEEDPFIRLQISCMVGENVPDLLKAFVGLGDVRL
jgi:hypothetical protein